MAENPSKYLTKEDLSDIAEYKSSISTRLNESGLNETEKNKYYKALVDAYFYGTIADRLAINHNELNREMERLRNLHENAATYDEAEEYFNEFIAIKQKRDKFKNLYDKYERISAPLQVQAEQYLKIIDKALGTSYIVERNAPKKKSILDDGAQRPKKK